jgi:hypothetical protein
MAAARFIRFFSRRQGKHHATTLNDENPPPPPSSNSRFLPNLLNSNGKIHSISKHHQSIPIKNGLVCTIVFLDGDDVNFEVDVSFNRIRKKKKSTTNRVDLSRHIVIYIHA